MKSTGSGIIILIFILAFRSLNLLSQSPGSGLYVIWYQNNKSPLDVPFITGGQVVVQWRDVDLDEGTYDFSSIARELHFLKEKRKMTTIQINGNLKPEWLFRVVPYFPGKLSVQVRDERGTLMYWHPIHLQAYRKMLDAFGSFLEKCEDRDAVLGIRMNFNAIGTEHMNVPPEARDLKNWIIPAGDTIAEEWTQVLAKTYETTVVNTFIEKVGPHLRVFVRNNIKPDIEEYYRKHFNNGTLAWFHTSSEAEPHSAGTEIQYRRFIEYCRSGKTVGYAEPWASAWGDHGNSTPDDRWCSPPQWNYWRLLLDLHCGVSFIALYANDLNVALSGKYAGKYDENRDKLGYMGEFMEAFTFTHKYAGLHASPEKSPGAWIAFRGNDTILAKNTGITPTQRKLSYLTGDYNFLMERLPDKTLAEHNIGPPEQRFGAWARLLPAGESIKIKTDERFAGSLKKGSIRIIFYNPVRHGSNSFRVITNGTKRKIEYDYTGRWETVTVQLPKGPLVKAGDGSHIIIKSGSEPLYFHMVEVNNLQ